MYATREQKLLQHTGRKDQKSAELIKLKWIIKLLYKPIEQIKGIKKEQLRQVIEEFPVIGKLYDLMGSFREILFVQKEEELDK